MTDFKALSERLASLADDGDYTIQWEDEGRQLLTDDEIDDLRQAARLIAGMGEPYAWVVRWPTEDGRAAALCPIKPDLSMWPAETSLTPLFAAAQEGAG